MSKRVDSRDQQRDDYLALLNKEPPGWSVVANQRVCDLDERELLRQYKELYHSGVTGHFHHDYRRLCLLRNIAPHPLLVGDTNTNNININNDKDKNDKNDKNDKANAKRTSQRFSAPLLDAPSSPSPSVLQLFGWEIDVPSLQILRVLLPSCKGLHTLHVKHAALNTQKIIMLADTIKASSIVDFALDYNPLNLAQGDDPSTWSLLIQAVNGSGLQRLSLRGNKLGDQNFPPCAKLLENNKNLQALDLFDNQLCEVSSLALRDLLQHNAVLLFLNLSRNFLNDFCAAQIMQGLSAQVVDKDDVKTHKKDGARVTNIKTRYYIDANNTLRYLLLADNYFSAAALTQWHNHMLEQCKFSPQRFMVDTETDEPRLYTELFEPKLATISSPSASGVSGSTPHSARKSISSGGGGGAAKSGGAAANKKEKDEDDVRFPGQINALELLSLRNQYRRDTLPLPVYTHLFYNPVVELDDAFEYRDGRGRDDITRGEDTRRDIEMAAREKREKLNKPDDNKNENLNNNNNKDSSGGNSKDAAASKEPATPTPSKSKKTASKK